MATLIKQTEGAVESHRTFGSAIDWLSKEEVWERVESYIAWRWNERTVTWIVEGPGEWHAPLTPATISTVEVWSRAGVWDTATLCASPLGGYFLPCTGPYRFTGTAGTDDAPIPRVVYLALQRLATYWAATGKPGVTSESFSVGGDLSRSIRRDANWMAMAMQNSGAADLLRPYRRV